MDMWNIKTQEVSEWILDRSVIGERLSCVPSGISPANDRTAQLHKGGLQRRYPA